MQPASLFHTVLLLSSGVKGSLQMCSTNLHILPITKIPVSLFQSFVRAAARNALRGLPEHPFQMTLQPKARLALRNVCWSSTSCAKRGTSHITCAAEGPGPWGQVQELPLRGCCQIWVTSDVHIKWPNLQSFVNDGHWPLSSWKWFSHAAHS